MIDSINLPKRISSLPLVKRIPWLKPLRYIPTHLQHLVVEQVLNQLLSDNIEDGELDFLQGHFLRIQITDLGYNWVVTKCDDKLALFRGILNADAAITGASREFLLLASRREDPDTLFFQRRLVIEGDTEMGLLVKNLIDSIDLDQLPRIVDKAIQFAADLAEEMA